MSAMKEQVGGDHYKKLAIQPAEFIHRNKIGFMEGSAIKYLTRWRDKGGVADLRKARHIIDMLIEMETDTAPPPCFGQYDSSDRRKDCESCWHRASCSGVMRSPIQGGDVKLSKQIAEAMNRE